MSTLHDFVHHQLGAVPGPVNAPAQNTQSRQAPPARKAPKGSIESNARADRARAKGQLKGDLYYAQQQAEPTLEGWTESPETVERKLLCKEEFPLG